MDKLRKREPTKGILVEMRNNLKIANNITLEAYLRFPYISVEIPIDEVQKINSLTYYTGLLKDDFNYLTKLDDLTKKKYSKEEIVDVGPQAGMAGVQAPQVPVAGLGKREVPVVNTGATAGEVRKHQIERQIDRFANSYLTSIQEARLAYRIEYSKDYLDRRLVDKQVLPDIMKICLKAPPSLVTSISCAATCKIVVVGFLDGHLESFYFYKEFIEESNADYDKFVPVSTSNLQTILDTPLSEITHDVSLCEYYGHQGAVTSIAVSYESSYFLSGSADCTIRLWSLKIGQCLAVYKGHIKTIWSLSLCPKGYCFASGGADSLVFLWLTNKNSPLMSFNQHQKDITHIEFTENLNYIVTSSLDRSLRVWSLEDASLVRIIFFPEAIKVFKLTMNGETIICGGEDGNVYIWNIVKPAIIHSFALSPQNQPIISIQSSIDEKFITISSKSKCLYFLLSKLRESKSKSSFEGIMGMNNQVEKSKIGWEELSLGGIEIKGGNSKEKIHLGMVNTRNQINIFTVEGR